MGHPAFCINPRDGPPYHRADTAASDRAEAAGALGRDGAGQGRSHGLTRVLITAGPTHEPIDAVRFIGNRSSGRVGVELADAASGLGWETTLLLGPSALEPTDSRVDLHRFRTADDLRVLLDRHFPACDVLIMAAAVADYRPARPAGEDAKLRRTGQEMSLALEPTPDLVASCASRRRLGQLLVGFALEPRDELMASAESKLARKGLDLIVANPLKTMDASTIEAWLVGPGGVVSQTPGPIAKADFAGWLVGQLSERRSRRSDGAAASSTQ